MNTEPNAFTRTLLEVPAALYRAAVWLRNRRYSREGGTVHPGVPVVSVGNLTVGGTGKTPLAAWLVHRLRDLGRQPSVVSRGYRGTAGRGPLVVSDGSGQPRVGPERCGDEPYLLARALPGTVVIVGSDRVAAAERARSLGADAIVLDDGFQHRRLARDLDLVLLDGSAPFGNGRLLPAGPLREPLSGLSRADVVLVTRMPPGERPTTIESAVRRHNASAPILTAGHRRVGFVTALGEPRGRPSTAVAFAGIANPGAFLADLESEGVGVVAFHAFRDHHSFTTAEWNDLVRTARRHDAGLVTTEKDLVRLPPAARDGSVPLSALRIEAVVHDEEALLRKIGEILEGPGE